MKIFFAYKNNQHRAAKVMAAFQRAILNEGHKVWTNEATSAMAIIYGCGQGHVEIIKRFEALGKPTLILDLGYWERNYNLGAQTHYKVVLGPHNHPQELIKKLNARPDRFEKSKQVIQPWRDNKDGHILLAGMGQKSCVLYGYPDQSWDMWAVKEIRKYTNRKIVYRPKPSWRNCPPIAGTEYSPPGDSLAPYLNSAFCVVNHHSNVGVDALLAGVPVFSWDGAAFYQSSQDLSKIETPYYPEDREKFLWGLCHYNWSVAEIENGLCWSFFWKNYLKKFA